MTSTDQKKNYLRWANRLIYASVVLGILLLAQLYALNVPFSLFFSILTGWILYVIVAIAVWTGKTRAYPLALILAIATLVVSLPSPQHLSLAETGPTLASLTFILGSILQIGVIVLIVNSMVEVRKRSRAPIE